MHYDALEIMQMRQMICDLERDETGVSVEERLLTYMANGTRMDDLREVYKDLNPVAFDYSRWNNTGFRRKWGGQGGCEVIGIEPLVSGR